MRRTDFFTTEVTEDTEEERYESGLVRAEIYGLDERPINNVTGQIVDAAMRVHTALGPGLLESAYECALGYELRKRGLQLATQVSLPLVYDGVRLEVGYRLDMVVEDCVIVEIKAIDSLADIHRAQLLSYLKLGGYKVGLLLNFNVVRMKDGIVRLVN